MTSASEQQAAKIDARFRARREAQAADDARELAAAEKRVKARLLHGDAGRKVDDVTLLQAAQITRSVRNRHDAE